MAIIIHLYPKPVLTLSLKEGGDLEPNTTYYFTGFFTHYGGYYGSVVSPAADEVSITTTDTKRTININWGTFPNNTIHGIVLKWDTQTLKNPDGSWRRYVNKWCCKYHEYGFGGTNRDITKSILYDSEYNGSEYQDGKFGHPELGWGYWSYPDIENNFKFPLNKGKFGIEVPDDGYTYDYMDLIEAIKNSDAKDLAFWGSNFLIMLGGTIFGNGKLHIKSRTIIQIYGMNCNNYTTFENSKLISESVGRQWSNARGNFLKSQFFVDGASLVLDLLSGKTIEDFQPFYKNGLMSYETGMSITTYDSLEGINIYDCYYLNFRYPRPDMFLKNMKFLNSHIGISISDRGEEFHVENNSHKVYFEELIFNNYGYKIYDIDFTSDCYVKNKEYNYYFDAILKNCQCNRPDGLIRSYMKGPESWTNIVRVRAFFYFSLEFYIKNKNDINLEDANIEIYDKEYNLVFSGVTDQNGYCYAEIIGYLTEHDPTDEEGNGLYSKIYDRNPFTIKINKSGYIDYYSIEKVYNKKIINISLQPLSSYIGEKLSINKHNDIISYKIKQEQINIELSDSK